MRQEELSTFCWSHLSAEQPLEPVQDVLMGHRCGGIVASFPLIHAAQYPLCHEAILS